MATDTTLDLLAPVHRLSAAQYLRMGEAGLLDPDVRVELMDGVVVEMSPIGEQHAWCVTWLARTLDRQLDDDHFTWIQNPVVLPEQRSVPEPDIAIVRRPGGPLALPGDALLVVEVSDTSLGYDRLTKARLYALRGVPEYWIVNVRESTVEIHRDADDGDWNTRTVALPGETLSLLALPDVRVDLTSLFGFIAGHANDQRDA